MFVKRPFGVKYPPVPGPTGLRPRPLSHPPSRLPTMSTATTIPTPALVFSPTPPPRRRRPRLVAVPEPDGAAAPVRPEVYRRRRLVVVALVLGLVLGLLSFGRQAGANRTAEAEAADAVTVVVAPGDTLWEIARTLAPSADPRPLADALADLAGGTGLQPGQRIVVPARLLD